MNKIFIKMTKLPKNLYNNINKDIMIYINYSKMII